MSMMTEIFSSQKIQELMLSVQLGPCVKSLATTRKPTTSPEPFTHFLMLSAQNKTVLANQRS